MQTECSGIAGLAGGVAVLSGLAYAGLRTRPAALPPHIGAPEDLGSLAVPPYLPRAISRYLRRIAPDGVPITETVALWGRGTAQLPLVQGVALPVPMVWKTVLAEGRWLRQDAWLTWFGRRLAHRSLEWREGRGRITDGRHSADGWSIDQSEQALMWLYTMLFAPSALLTEPAVEWETVADTRVLVYLPNLEAEWYVTLEFDSVTALLRTLSTQRFRLTTARPELYRLTVADYCWFGGIALPTTITAAWDATTAYRVALDGLTTNIPLLGARDRPTTYDVPWVTRRTPAWQAA